MDKIPECPSVILVMSYFGFYSFGITPWGEAKASVTFRVPSLLVVQQRWVSVQRAPAYKVPYLLALSKPSLNGVLGGRGADRSL